MHRGRRCWRRLHISNGLARSEYDGFYLPLSSRASLDWAKEGLDCTICNDFIVGLTKIKSEVCAWLAAYGES